MSNVSLIQCRNIVRRLCAKHRWQLLREDEYVERLWARRHEAQDTTDAQIQALAIAIYCEEWHQACGDHQRQEQGYGEVLHFLYDHALYKCPDPERARDIAQDAARRVYEEFAKCPEPQFFLSFLLYRLRHAETYSWRKQNQEAKQIALSFDGLDEKADDNDAETIQFVDVNALSPEQNSLCLELRRQLFALYEQLLQERPRAARQLKAVIYKFHGEYSDEEIMAFLDVNIDNVYTLRNRGLAVLRKHQAFCQLLKTIVENCTESKSEV